MGRDFEKVDTSYNFPKLDRRILKLWEERDIFKKSLEKDAPKGKYIFYEGPPTANNNPHIGNMLTRILKDLFPRFRTMQGYYVARKAGWDCHGLPVEIEMEKRLGLEDKEEIEKLKDTYDESISYFNELCCESVLEYIEEWVRQTHRIGYWLDTDDAYFTMDNAYVESVWWILDRMKKRDFLYKGHKILPYCPLCGTSLSSHEVAQNYKEVKDPSITVRLRLAPGQTAGGFTTDGKTSFLVWTTTPWTLLSNAAVCLHPDVTYAVIEHEDKKAGKEKLILAEPLLAAYGLEDDPVLHRLKGSELAGLRYEPLFPDLDTEGKDTWYAITDEFVTTEDGTGIVHIAPAFGEDDYRLGREHDLPVFSAITSEGGLVREVEEKHPDWKGKLIKDFGQGEGVDPDVITNLKYRGLLFKSKKYLHQYPFCWRHDTPLIYYAVDSWFFKTTAIKDDLIEANRKIEWRPEHMRDGRMGNWLEGVIDWAISRNRYWGTPLPIWVNDRTGEVRSFGSFSELFTVAGMEMPDDFYDRSKFNPHRPHIDEVTWEDGDGGTWRRIPEVVDCWFDAGAMPYAQVHFPFDRDKYPITDWWPADFIAEGIDQTRGWFFTLLVIGTFLAHDPEFQKLASSGDKSVVNEVPPAYRVCIANGHVLDEEGRKMSKRIGNVVDLMDVVEVQGADAARWYFYQAQPLGSIRMSMRAVRESQQKFIIPLYNVYSFFTIYANIDGFDPAEMSVSEGDFSILDRWITGRFNLAVERLTRLLEDYRIMECTEVLDEFVDHLSNWYLRRSRRRFWQSEKTQDKWAAYVTLYRVLVGLSKLSAPFIPFLSEEMHQNLAVGRIENAKESVHLEDWPSFDEDAVDESLDRDMADVLTAVNLGRSARASAVIKIRQPLSRVTLISTDPLRKERLAPYEGIIADELNVKTIAWAEDSAEFVEKKLRLNFPVAGPRLGKLLPGVKAALEGVSDIEGFVSRLESDGRASLAVDGESVDILETEVEVQIIEQEGSICQAADDLLVVLDTGLTPELVAEGRARELVNRIQTIRKKLDLSYEERIKVEIAMPDELSVDIARHLDYVKGEVLATGWDEMPEVTGDGAHEAKIDGFKVELRIMLQ